MATTLIYRKMISSGRKFVAQTLNKVGSETQQSKDSTFSKKMLLLLFKFNKRPCYLPDAMEVVD
jgi:hypothetical protein